MYIRKQANHRDGNKPLATAQVSTKSTNQFSPAASLWEAVDGASKQRVTRKAGSSGFSCFRRCKRHGTPSANTVESAKSAQFSQSVQSCGFSHSVNGQAGVHQLEHIPPETVMRACVITHAEGQ
jgi:hypothetical protein